jgi:hypothetical protein
VGKTERLYHVNVLKKYVDRVVGEKETHVASVVMTDTDEEDYEKAGVIPLFSLRRERRHADVCVADECSPQQRAELKAETKKGQADVVQWNEQTEQAFVTLKAKLCEKPVLVMANMEEPFVLRTDASDRGLGAVLLQEKDEVLHPVAYASKKLSGAQTHYSTIEKECMAIVWGVQKFEPYLYGKQFVIETDHRPLVYLQRSKTENGRLMRWAIQLQQYDFKVRVIAGKDNVGADYLSRSM